jgi:hypothetical protein
MTNSKLSKVIMEAVNVHQAREDANAVIRMWKEYHSWAYQKCFKSFDNMRNLRKHETKNVNTAKKEKNNHQAQN